MINTVRGRDKLTNLFATFFITAIRTIYAYEFRQRLVALRRTVLFTAMHLNFSTSARNDNVSFQLVCPEPKTITSKVQKSQCLNTECYKKKKTVVEIAICSRSDVVTLEVVGD